MALQLYRIKIITEEKAKVVAAAWGTELLQFRAPPPILHKDDLKNRMYCIMNRIVSG